MARIARHLSLLGLFAGTVAWAAEAELLGGDWAGARPWLAGRAVTVRLDYTAEIFDVVRGGLKCGGEAQGLASLSFDADLEKSGGWRGATAHGNFYGTHGASISGQRAGDFGHLSNIDFSDSVRLFELWVQKSWGDTGVSLRAGQLALDAEFVGVDSAAVLCNSDFGACGALSANLPVPIFAVAALGLRLKAELAGGRYAQIAVYDGNPAPDFLGDRSPGFVAGTRYNRHGLRVKLSADEGALTIAEIGGAAGDGREVAWRAGAFYHSDTFSDQRFGGDGRALADPRSSGTPAARRGDYGAYGVFDATVWRNGVARANAFARVAAVPSDRNLVESSWETGVALTGIFPGRPADVVALGVAGLQWSGRARAAVRDANAFDGTNESVPDGEHVIELTWRAEIRAGWTVQPDVQWIRHPGGSSARRDVLAVGLRTGLSF